MLIENNVQFLSLFALVLAAAGVALLLSLGRSRAAQVHSRVTERYFRDLRKIDDRESRGEIDSSDAELARDELLKRAVAEKAADPLPWLNFKDRRVVYFSMVLVGITLSGSFGLLATDEQAKATGISRNNPVAVSAAVPVIKIAGADSDFSNLTKYLNGLSAKGGGKLDFQGAASKPNTGENMSQAPSVPDVDTMIARLEKRLEAQPGNIEGWRMLGWSYFNTQRYKKSVAAYERAVKLAPSSAKLQVALAEARKKAQTKPVQPSAGAGAGDSKTMDAAAAPKGPTEQDIKDSQKMTPSARQAMIRSMVDGLAARLKDKPRNPAGWQRLIRSRMVLGEKKAASQALARALDVFAKDPQIKERIVSAAKQLGVEPIN